MNVSNVVHGALRSCTVGYWIDGATWPAAASRRLRSRWSSTTASPRSGCTASRSTSGRRTRPSLRVVEKLGLRREGYYERFLDIDGAWRDHVAFAMTVEELGGRTMLSRLALLPPMPAMARFAAAQRAALLNGSIALVSACMALRHVTVARHAARCARPRPSARYRERGVLLV